MKTSLRGLAGLASMVLAPATRVFALVLIVITPAFAQMLLLSETRSVTVSYYGSGVGTVSSAGTFGIFEASAVGIPFGGGSMTASQKSNITTSEITIEHYLNDFYGPGGYALSFFDLKFSLSEYTRMTMTGYCNNFSGFVSLTSETSGAIPVDWHGASPSDFYRNFLDFDRVLSPGTYTLASFETPRDAVFTRILINASSVPDAGAALVLFGIALVGLLGAKRWLT